MPRIAAVKMIIPIDAPMKPLAMMISGTGAVVIKSSGFAIPNPCIRTWFSSPTSDGLMTHSHKRMYSTDGLMRGSSQTPRKKPPDILLSEVVVSANTRPKLTLKIVSVPRT